MSKPLFALLYVAIFTSPVLAQIKTCGNVWQTTKEDGTADTIGDNGTPCTPMKGAPAGTCTGIATTEADAVCSFSAAVWGYRCCYQLTPVTFSTPAPGATFATLGPGTVATPQNLKPKCPNSAMSTMNTLTNLPITCNMTNPKNQGCPYEYRCTKAVNVYDVYGTPRDGSDDLGAGMVPNICCKITTLSSYANVFTEAGLTPTLVPLAPLAGIDSVTLGDTAKHVVYLSDDLSYVPGLLTTAPITITTLSTVEVKTIRVYHALFFDATNNKDCVFRVNIELTRKGQTIYDLYNLMVNGAATAAQVYNAGPASAPVYKYSQKYMPPKFNTSPHRFVMLLWTTPKLLPIAAVGVKSTTMFNLNAGLNGDLEPGRVAGKAGNFTTVSALLAGKIKTILGRPMAGTYFFLTT
uniref:Uncharacterized protein n=1 Tax=Plectus sambesii TaxID=2011161 RepID=A0A914XB80_9BILA